MLELAVNKSLEKFTKDVSSMPIESLKDKIPDFKTKPLPDETIKKIPTINGDMDGSKHPESDVPYLKKIVENNHAEKVEGVFPDFSKYSKFEINLPDNMLTQSDKKQNIHCNNELKKAFDSETLDAKGFSGMQIDQISNGDKPQGYTWHHNEEKGKMELIPTEIHSTTRHTGGRNIWGGGTSTR